MLAGDMGDVQLALEDVQYADQARLRPYNADEMKALVGKLVTMPDDSVALCTAWSSHNNGIVLDNMTWYPEDLVVGKFTIDGKPVEISGIALPAGTGSSTQEIWWNLQQIVVKDVELAAGTHTFTCVILADGAGINAGAMEIYYAAN
jgi:hypothetical protein